MDIDCDVAGAAKAEAAFLTRFGRRPSGVWGAPGRVNLIGEHTDYSEGFVLPFALERLTAVAAAPASGPEWTVFSESIGQAVSFDADALAPGAVAGWAGYVAGVVWSLRAAGYEVRPAELAIVSEVPVGSGLSSSAALECAVLAALVDLGGHDVPEAERPTLAQRAEAGYVGMPCGIMDQSASVRCRRGHALFLDCRSLAVRHIPFDPTAHDLSVLVIDTRAPHRLVSGEYAARRRDSEAAARALGVAALRDVSDGEELTAALRRLEDDVLRRRARHVVTENARVLATVAELSAGGLAAIGELLTASHASLRDDYQVTVPEVDTAVAAALEAGALGARMTGGGFGGCVLALVRSSEVGEVSAAVAKAFSDRGFREPVPFSTRPGAGARRLG
jgi:galactokinase